MLPLTGLLWSGLFLVHIAVLRLAARALGLPTGRVFLLAGASRARAALAALAAPLAHLAVAVLATFAVLAGWGVADRIQVVAAVVRPAPAEGLLRAGDVLLAVDGHALTPETWFPDLVQPSEGRPVTVRVRRADAPLDVTVVPVRREGLYVIGVHIEHEVEGRAIPKGTALARAAAAPVGLARQMLAGLATIVRGTVPADLVGPVGIVNLARLRGRSGEPTWVTVLERLALQAAGLGFLLLFFDLAWILVRVRAPQR